MKLSLLLTILVLPSLPAPPYPIPPQPLRKLYLESDLVAIVVPGETVNRRDRTSVDVKIQKSIKGKAPGETIRVYYEPLVFCPPSAHFPKGSTVLAFLQRKGEGSYDPFAWSYSTKSLSEIGLRQYEDRMAELAQLKEEQLKGLAGAEALEWVVKCAEHPATRMEAVYEFQGTPDYPASEKRTPPIQFDSLTEGQRGRVVKAFLDSKVLGYPEVGLAEFLAPVKDRRIATVLRGGLANAISNKSTFLGSSLMDVLSQRLDIKEWATLQNGMYEYKTDELGERSFGYAEEGKRLKILEDALALVNSKLK